MRGVIFVLMLAFLTVFVSLSIIYPFMVSVLFAALKRIIHDGLLKGLASSAMSHIFEILSGIFFDNSRFHVPLLNPSYCAAFNTLLVTIKAIFPFLSFKNSFDRHMKNPTISWFALFLAPAFIL